MVVLSGRLLLPDSLLVCHHFVDIYGRRVEITFSLLFDRLIQGRLKQSFVKFTGPSAGRLLSLIHFNRLLSAHFELFTERAHNIRHAQFSQRLFLLVSLTIFELIKMLIS